MADSIDSAIIFTGGNQKSLMKGNSDSFAFTGTKAAKVVFLLESGGTGVQITATVDNTDTLPDAAGNKYYENFTGVATILTDDTATVETSYVFTCNLLNSDDKIMGTNKYTVIITRPLPKLELLSATTLQINKDIKTTLSIQAKEASMVNIKNVEELKDIVSTEITNINHSADKNDSLTYDSYTFDIVFTPTGTATNITMVLELSNDDGSTTADKNIILNVYDPIYTSVEAYMGRLDVEAAHKVKLSYTEKKGYNLPAAFISGGEEVASLLVAKYPVSQESVDGKTTDEILGNLSKPYRSRVRLYKDSKYADNTGPEEGELHKLVMVHGLDTVLDNIKSTKYLNGYAYPVLNSSFLDTMLANMSDAGFIANMDTVNFNYNNNYDVSLKPINVGYETSENVTKLTGYKYQLALTTSRTNDHSYSTVEDTKNSLYSKGAEWYAGKKRYTVSDNTIVESTDSKILGEMQSSAYNTLDKTKHFAFPVVSSTSMNTHNGQANGIVDMFGAGIKVYTDCFYVYEDGVDKLKILDPYKTKVEYDSPTHFTRENDFVEIGFNTNSFMANTDSVAFIGPNENNPNNLVTRSVFSNYSYKDFKDGYLMDSVGLPMDNSVMDYPNDITFKGNAGYSKVPNWHYGRSPYYVDYRTIRDNGGTRGYFVSGSVGNGKLIFGDKDEIHTNELDWSKLYTGDKNIFTGLDLNGFGVASAGNRSRILLHENTLFGYNKKAGYTDDDLYYNNRLHFLIFDLDRMERNNLVNLEVNTKFIELEESKSTKLDITTDGTLSVSSYNTNGIHIDLDTLILTGLKAGTYEFIISSEATNKDTASSKIYVKVVDLLTATALSADMTSITGVTDDTFYVTVTTNATDISSVISSAHANIVSKETVSDTDKDNIVFKIGVKLIAVTRPETSLIITATAANSKTSTLEIPIVIAQRVDTKYDITVKSITVGTNAELQGQLNTNYLAKKLGLTTDGINITNLRSVCIWSTSLAGHAWKVNSDFTFGIDFGNVNISTFTINYEAQLDQEYEFDGFIPATKPEAKVKDNLNQVVSGTITVHIQIVDEAKVKGAKIESKIANNEAMGGVTYTNGFVAIRKEITAASYSFSPADIGTVVEVTPDDLEVGKEHITIKMSDPIEFDTDFTFIMTTTYNGAVLEKLTIPMVAKSSVDITPTFDKSEYSVQQKDTLTGTITVSDHVTLESTLDPALGEITFTKL